MDGRPWAGPTTTSRTPNRTKLDKAGGIGLHLQTKGGGGGMEPMITALLRSRAYPHPTGPITLVETHISWVVLTGSYAYKVKKPVNFGFVDFSSLQKRRHFCHEELRLNQRLAPDLYLDLVEIHGPAEQANVEGSGTVIDVAVRMRQFDQSGLLPQALEAGAVSGEQLERFAEKLATFQSGAAVAPPEGCFGTPEAVSAPALANLEVLSRLHKLDQDDPLLGWTNEEARRLNAIFARRLVQSRVREGHGDLHLGNLVLHQGEVMAFDCLEFNPGLRWIDVLSDVAFLAMDLQQRGMEVFAGRVLSRWLNTTGDYLALSAWPWYLTYRALVRAKVIALRLEQIVDPSGSDTMALHEQLSSYLKQAGRSSRLGEGPGALILTHGVSGSGKSHVANQLCRRHGWIHLRSDVERLRLFGLWGTTIDPVRQGGRYDQGITEELYSSILLESARAILKAGLTAVVDATFLKQSQRAPFLKMAASMKASVVILVFPVSLGLAKERISRRMKENVDPSEADHSVLMQQWSSVESPHPFEGAQIIIQSIVEAEKQLNILLPGILRTIPGSLPPQC